MAMIRQQVSEQTLKAFLWLPVLLRGFCWVLAEMTIIAAALLNEFADKPQPINPLMWWIFALTLIGKGAMTLRLFLDQSVSEHGIKLSTGNTQIFTK